MKRGQVQLVSPVDSTYGVRIRRTISLDSQKPVVTIKTVYGESSRRARSHERLDHYPARFA
jgi:hypothetical protein